MWLAAQTEKDTMVRSTLIDPRTLAIASVRGLGFEEKVNAMQQAANELAPVKVKVSRVGISRGPMADLYRINDRGSFSSMQSRGFKLSGSYTFSDRLIPSLAVVSTDLWLS